MKIYSAFVLLLLITTAAQSAEMNATNRKKGNAASKWFISGIPTGPTASQPAVFPVKLISFTAKSTREGVELMWLTANEADNAFFTIERSLDAVTFQAIQQFKGAGTSHKPLSYLAIDQSYLNETAYYRLTQTSFNGESTVSKVISVVSTSATTFSIYPNPAGAGESVISFW
ncbi:MAG: hypothetical protein V4714_05565 [Bacteroidota bacterium]